MSVPLICKICEKTFYVSPYRKNIAKCCSRQCLWHLTKPNTHPNWIAKVKGKIANNSAGKKMKCLNCKNYFNISPSRIGIKWYCSKLCYNESRKKPKRKYKFIRVNGIKILEHRFIMENHLGRKLLSTEHVHHIDGDSLNNNFNNLHVLNCSDHARLTSKEIKH